MIGVRGSFCSHTQTQTVIRVKAQSMAGARGAMYLAKVKVTICAWVRNL